MAERGLSAAEVADRVARGQVNDVPSAPTRTIGQIVRANLLTRFNLLLGSLLAVILVVGPLQDALFGLVIVANTVVGIVQEVRAKRTLDRLEVVNAPRAKVVRDGQPGRAGRRPGGARRRARGRRRGPGGGGRRGAGGGRAGGRRVAAHRRVRDGDPRGRRPAALGQLRGRRERPLPGDQGGPGGLRGPADRGGQALHPGPLRAAGRGRPDPQVRHLGAGPHGGAAVRQPAPPGARGPGRAQRGRGRDRGHGPRGAGPADQRRLRRRGGPPRPAPGAGPRAAGGRDPGPGGRHLLRQDGHHHRRRPGRAGAAAPGRGGGGGGGGRRPRRPGRGRPQPQRHPAGHRPGVPGPGRLAPGGGGAVLLGPQVERGQLRRPRRLPPRRPRGAAGPRRGRARPTGTAPCSARPSRSPSRAGGSCCWPPRPGRSTARRRRRRWSRGPWW